MTDRYELVSWEEVRPVKMELNTINQRASSYIEHNCPELGFYPELVGSAERGLVTRIIGGPEGFDLDYNYIIDPPGKGKGWKADVVKQCFMEAIDYAVQGTEFSHAKDSTRAITIKKVNRKTKKIEYSCDIAIIYFDEDGSGYWYLHNNKKTNSRTRREYTFNHRTLKYPIEDMEQYIFDNVDDPKQRICDEYLKVKNSDRQDKQSFTLYIDSLFNIINQIDQELHIEQSYYDDDGEW